MLDYDFENSVGYWVFATAHALACAMNEELAAHGITSRQWEVLACISHDGELSQSELAERMHIEAPTLVGVLDRMERDGWIVRDHGRQRSPPQIDSPHCARRRGMGSHGGLRLGRASTCDAGLGEDELRKLRETLKTMCENMHALVSGRITHKGAAPANTAPTNGAPAEVL